MFEAPRTIIQIPDIEQIYAINEGQGEALDNAVEQIDSDLFFDSMGEDATSHWERFLDLSPGEDDNLTTRRFRVKAKATERLPYSLRVFKRRLDDLFGTGNYALALSENLDHIHLKFGLEYAKAMQDAIDLIETIAPLNMTYEVEASSERSITGWAYEGIAITEAKTIKVTG